MLRGMLTEHMDVAQVVLYAFWVFFAGLIFYIRREDRREGYPLENDKTGELAMAGFPLIPDAKTFRLPNGLGAVFAPNGARDRRPIKAEKIAPFAGAPLEPTGNPLADGVGPAAWAERADRPDFDVHGNPRIRPMRLAPAFSIDENDPDLRGWTVVGMDGVAAGTVTDIWVDQMEHVVRYVEMSRGSGSSAIVPLCFAQLDEKRGVVYVHALRAMHFAGVPALRNPDQITLLEEDKITGYFGGGLLYATPQRSEPLL